MKNIVNTDRKISNNKTPEIVRNNIAIDLAINGMTTSECANKYGIARQTICRWLRNDREFVNTVDRYKEDYINQKVDAIKRTMINIIDDQVQNVINISKDEKIPPSTRLDASKFIINKFISDCKGQSIHTQNNTQINIDNSSNNNKSIEEILKSLDDNIIDTNNKDDDF